jgi:hypothetical protein
MVEVTVMRVRGALLLVVPLLAILAGAYLIRSYQKKQDPAAASLPWAESPGAEEAGESYQPTPVSLNRGPEVGDGFQGNVHPLLFGGTGLEVTARWAPVGDADRMRDPALDAWFTNLRPAQARQTYTASDFSGFLPPSVGEVGQLWALDETRVVKFLRQFHPRPSLRQVAVGRRAGPDGAFAILRAVSPSYLDIAFRVHAEFSLEPEPGDADPVPVRVWYTPAAFVGSVLVNRRTGTVESFRLELPIEKALNAHLTVADRRLGKNQPHAIVRVEYMDLTGGNGGRANTISWTKALSPAEAERRLAKVF